MTVRKLTRDEARRIAIRAQLLDAARPTALLGMLEQLTLLQLDPTAAIAPAADLVAWSRIGSDYQPAQLERALDRDRTVFEQHAQPTPVEPVLALVRPMSDLRLYLADMVSWASRGGRRVEWMTANGVRFAPGGIRPGAAGHDICFIHPKGNDEFPIGGEGVLIELVQAPPAVIAALG